MTERSAARRLTAETDTRLVGWLVVAIVGLGLLAYANSFPGAFFFDDDAAVVQNTSIRNLHDWRNVLWPPVQAGIGGRPFGNLVFAINYALGGLQPAAYHSVNVAIHLAAALLLFGLTRRTLRLPVMASRFGASATAIAGIVALLWMLNPLQTSIADYVSQRTEGLMGALYFLTLYAFLRGATENSKAWHATAVIACLLGMATKEDMVTAPALVLLYDRTFVSGSFLGALRRHAGVYVGLALTWVLLGCLVYASRPSERGIGFSLGRTWQDYALTECRTLTRYLGRTVWPHPLIFDYGPLYAHSVAEVWWNLGVLVVVIAATAYALWRAPVIGFAAAAFFILVSPSSSVVPVVQQPCAENRLYLPLVGTVALLAVLGYRAAGRRSLVAFGAVAVALAGLTYARNPAFASEVAIWNDTVAKNPTNERAQNNLGNALLKLGKTEAAAPHFDAALQLSPHYGDAHNNRGVVLLRRGKPAEAVVEFQAATADKKDFADALYNLGEAYIQLGRAQDAVNALEATLKLDPNNPKAHNNLGIALLDRGRVDDSIRAEQTALRLDPKMPEAHYNLGNALARAGRVPDALAEYKVATDLDPKFAKAHNNAGALLLQVGKTQEARAEFEAALKINPAYPEAQRNLTLVGPGRG